MALFKKIKTMLKENLPLLYTLYSKHKTNKLIRNYFNTSLPRNILICYITHAFKKNARIIHTNIAESMKIAEEFRDLGYNCHITNYNNDKKINYNEYDVIFGFGKSFNNSFFSNTKAKRLFYGTGRHPYYSNNETIKRGLSFLKEHNSLPLNSLRLVNEDYSLQIDAANELILLGGDDVVLNYKKYSDREDIYNLNTSFYKILDYKHIVNNKNYTEAKNNFLFFSGGGMIHKGLDILLDIFSKRDDINLHICASVDDEKEFASIYNKQLYKTNKIHTYNFVDIKSEKFSELLQKCCFVILPSCSEVIPTSVINIAGNGGLIPILTKPASINADNLCIMAEEPNVRSIEQAIEQAKNISIDKLKDMSFKIGEKINSEYTLNNFVENFRKIIKKILK